jgi:hypothetical protein
VPDNFVRTAPAYDPSNPRMQRGSMPTEALRNPQTVELLDMLGLPYNLDRAGAQAEAPGARGSVALPFLAGLVFGGALASQAWHALCTCLPDSCCARQDCAAGARQQVQTARWWRCFGYAGTLCYTSLL